MVTSLFSVLVSLILITSLIVGCSDMLSNNWDSPNEEKLKGELKRTYPSPDGEYTLKIYYVDRDGENCCSLEFESTLRVMTCSLVLPHNKKACKVRQTLRRPQSRKNTITMCPRSFPAFYSLSKVI
jgi:hypothetical protein